MLDQGPEVEAVSSFRLSTLTMPVAAILGKVEDADDDETITATVHVKIISVKQEPMGRTLGTKVYAADNSAKIKIGFYEVEPTTKFSVGGSLFVYSTFCIAKRNSYNYLLLHDCTYFFQIGSMPIFVIILVFQFDMICLDFCECRWYCKSQVL